VLIGTEIQGFGGDIMRIKQEDKKILKKLLLLFKPYVKNIIIILICMIASAGISTLIPLLSKQTVDSGLMKNNFSLLIILVAASFLLVMADQGIGLIETRYRVLISCMMPYELSKRAFKHLMKLNISYFNNTNYAEIMNNINLDVGNISKVSDRNLFFIVTQVFKMLGGVVGLFIIDWKLTVIVLAIIPVKYKTVKFLAAKRQKTFTGYMEAYGDYSSWYGDTISGIKEIKLMGIERVKTGQFIRKQKSIIKTDVAMNILDKINELSETVLLEIVTGLLYIIGAYLILHARFTVGGLIAFITYCVYVIGPISAVLNIGYSFSDIFPSAKRFFGFLDMEHEESGNKAAGIIDINKVQGNIKFDNVEFQYSEENKILKNINFEIHKGEKVAIIGSNGSGKTTLINLLLRILKPGSGRILLDGTDIGTIRLKEYRQLISVVSQDIYLFNTTVKENINPFSSGNDIKVRTASRKSRVDGFIEELPLKYDTVVGLNGANLSGGQKQKIALARAIAKDSKILILDEATSNYDMKSEIDMIDLVMNGLKGKTVLMITHKLPVLKAADKIIFVENGRVGDCGKHDDLYLRNRVYRDIINSFNRKLDEKPYNCQEA
jgi:ATP-binding cassette subfamily B protein